MRRCLLLGLVLTALTVASPAQLGAQDDHAKKAKDGHEHKGGSLGGISEGIFKGALDLSLWTIVVFVLLVLVLRKFAWGPILDGLKAREEGIARDKAEAEHARKEAAKARAEMEAAKAQALAEVAQMIAKGKQDAQATADEEIARVRAELQAERVRLQHEMETEQRQSWQQLVSQVAHLATLISSKAIGKQLGYDDHRALVEESLKEFRAAGHARVEDIESARS
jgi:F-type H+-transporting ATPase subunit b